MDLILVSCVASGFGVMCVGSGNRGSMVIRLFSMFMVAVVSLAFVLGLQALGCVLGMFRFRCLGLFRFVVCVEF